MLKGAIVNYLFIYFIIIDYLPKKYNYQNHDQFLMEV